MCEVRWLECAFSPPKPAVGTNMTSTKQGQVWDMCCVQQRQKEVLVTTRGFDGGVYGYNTTTGELEWRMKCKLPGVKKEISPRGVTTDGRGNIYVCDDSNECIQLFSVDGVYNGSVMKEGKPSLGEPCRIRWCSRTSSMVVAHLTNKYYRISKIQGTADDVPGLLTKDTNMQIDLTEKQTRPLSPCASTSADNQTLISMDTVIVLESPIKETSAKPNTQQKDSPVAESATFNATVRPEKDKNSSKAHSKRHKGEPVGKSTLSETTTPDATNNDKEKGTSAQQRGSLPVYKGKAVMLSLFKICGRKEKDYATIYFRLF